MAMSIKMDERCVQMCVCEREERESERGKGSHCGEGSRMELFGVTSLRLKVYFRAVRLAYIARQAKLIFCYSDRIGQSTISSIVCTCTLQHLECNIHMLPSVLHM